MTSYVVRRVLWSAALFLVLTAFTFVIFFVIPGTGQQVTSIRLGRQVQVADQLKLTGPVVHQYLEFLGRIVTHASLGRSVFNRRPVNSLVLDSASVTAAVVTGGMIVGLLIALTVGIASALRPRSRLDKGAMTFVLMGVSLHPAWIGLTLSFLLGTRLGWLPNAGYCNLFHPIAGCGGPRQWTSHLILPWITFALPFAALYTRMIRAYVIEALQADHVQMARAKGASETRVLRVHVLRTALLPLVTMIATDFGTAFLGTAFAGTVFIETVFGLPGLGSLLVNAGTRLDLPVLVGVTVFVTTLILALSLVADLVYPLVDPRARVARPLHLRLPVRRREPQPASPSQPAQTFS